jgi:hypothetical protein
LFAAAASSSSSSSAAAAAAAAAASHCTSMQPVCLLLALHTLGISKKVARVLQHPGILKVGIGIAHDMMDLLRSHEASCEVQVGRTAVYLV